MSMLVVILLDEIFVTNLRTFFRLKMCPYNNFREIRNDLQTCEISNIFNALFMKIKFNKNGLSHFLSLEYLI